MTPNQAAFFCFFSLVAYMERKEVCQNKERDNEYPTNMSATCFCKMLKEILCIGDILPKGLLRFTAKRLPRPSAGSVFLPAPIAIGGGSGYGNGLCAELPDIMKKSPVWC